MSAVYGRTVEDPSGETHTVFGLAFQDSPGNAQRQVGCAWSTFRGPRDGLQPGPGYTAMIVQRPDILDGVPFPPVLPLASLRCRQATPVATYLPNLNGGVDHGSVPFGFGRFTLE